MGATGSEEERQKWGEDNDRLSWRPGLFVRSLWPAPVGPKKERETGSGVALARPLLAAPCWAQSRAALAVRWIVDHLNGWTRRRLLLGGQSAGGNDLRPMICISQPCLSLRAASLPSWRVGERPPSTMQYAVCSMHHAVCTMLYALCSQSAAWPPADAFGWAIFARPPRPNVAPPLWEPLEWGLLGVSLDSPWGPSAARGRLSMASAERKGRGPHANNCRPSASGRRGVQGGPIGGAHWRRPLGPALRAEQTMRERRGGSEVAVEGEKCELRAACVRPRCWSGATSE